MAQVFSFAPTVGADPADRRRKNGSVSAVVAVRRQLGLLSVLLVLAVFFLWPLVDIALRSFNTKGLAEFGIANLTLDHYTAILTSEGLRSVLVNTVIVSGISAFIVLLLAFPAAYLMSRLSRRWSTTLYLLFFVPFFISILIRLFAFTQILSQRGPVNQALAAFGLGPYPLLFNMFSTILGMVAYLLPLAVLVMYAGMAAVDPGLISAAKVAGASGWQAFRRVYLPQVRSAVIGAVLLTFVMGLGFFLTPAVLGGAESITVSTFIATQVQNFQWGEASAVGVVLLIATILVFTVAIRMSGLTNLAGGFGVGKGTSRPEPLRFSPLSVVLAIVTGIGLTVLIVPVLLVFPIAFQDSSLIVWPPSGFSLEWLTEVIENPIWLAAIGKSLRVGLISMVLAVAMGFAGARAMLRTADPGLRGVLTALLYSPMIVPVILLAVGSYGPQQTLGLLGTDIGLAAAQATLALPFTVTTFLAALGGLDRRIEQASWTLGASTATTNRRILAPIILPSIIGAGLLGFVNSWDEATVALFHSVGADTTLPVLIFSSVKSGAQPTIAAVGAILILAVIVAFALVAIVTWVRNRPGRPVRNAQETEIQ